MRVKILLSVIEYVMTRSGKNDIIEKNEFAIVRFVATTTTLLKVYKSFIYIYIRIYVLSRRELVSRFNICVRRSKYKSVTSVTQRRTFVHIIMCLCTCANGTLRSNAKPPSRCSVDRRGWQ